MHASTNFRALYIRLLSPRIIPGSRAAGWRTVTGILLSHIVLNEPEERVMMSKGSQGSLAPEEQAFLDALIGESLGRPGALLGILEAAQDRNPHKYLPRRRCITSR